FISLLSSRVFWVPNVKPTEDVGAEDFNTDRLSYLEWIINLLFPSDPITEGPDPEPIDPSKCEPCKCGLTNKHHRIVGGQETEVNQYPWMAQLLYGGRFYCGASLINTKYVLTASHCLKGFSSHCLKGRTENSCKVKLMDHARGTSDETMTIDRRVKDVIIHRKYDDTSFNNDIALVRLDNEVKIEGLLRPVCLPTLGKSYSGTQGVVTGWGVTVQNGAPSDVLNEVTVPIMGNSECRKSAYGEKKITDNMMCAGYPEGKKDSCQGDSGGPLHIMNGTVHDVVGVVSWGEGCAKPNHPGVYTRVNRYMTWIKRHTQDACYCD
ncbi:hypothetical protein L9F63_004371, partial [Diploptera punctata]